MAEEIIGCQLETMPSLLKLLNLIHKELKSKPAPIIVSLAQSSYNLNDIFILNLYLLLLKKILLKQLILVMMTLLLFIHS